MSKAFTADLFATGTTGRDQLVGQNDYVDGRSDQVVGFQSDLRKLCKAVWPTKTAQFVSIAADVTVRQAERFLAGDQGLGVGPVLRLIRSGQGERFLRLMMSGCEAEWWKEVGQERQITELKKRRKALERELRELEGGAL